MAKRQYRGRRGNHGAFTRLELAASPFHRLQWRDTRYTTVGLVRAFIEKSPEREARRKARIKILKRSIPGRASARRLEACCSSHRCGHPLCPECAYVFRVWIISQLLAIYDHGLPASTIVIRLAHVRLDALVDVDRQKLFDRLRKELLACGITCAIGHLEAAFNIDRQTWCIHVHLVVFGDVSAAIRRLRARLNSRRGIPSRPVDGQEINDSDYLTQITYSFKFQGYYRFRGRRKSYPLPPEPLGILGQWLQGVRLTDHLFALGFRRRGAIEIGEAFWRIAQRHRRAESAARRIRRHDDLAT